jgi:hypothetical protein
MSFFGSPTIKQIEERNPKQTQAAGQVERSE